MTAPARSRAGLLLLAAGALCLPLAGHAAPRALALQGGPDVAPAAAGLIVKLRPSAARLDTLASRGASGASASGSAASDNSAPNSDAASPLAAAHAERVRAVVARAGLGAATQRPVGSAAQLLDFGHVLSAAEAHQMAEKLRQQPDVEWVVPNEREQRQTVPNDPYFAASATSPGQWWLHPVAGSSTNVLPDRLRGVPGLQSAWLQSTGSAATVVAVLDSGITPHPDLAAHVLLPGYDFVADAAHANDGDGRDADASDPGDWVSQADKDGNAAVFGRCEPANSSWHGTVTAGIVAAVADNGVGVAGVNWQARVLPVRVAGKCGAAVADIVDGMRWAAGLPVAGTPINANPARVVNISYGGSAACNAAYQEAIEDLRAVGTVVVASAGNGHGGVKRPASCTGVIGVAALNRDGFKATYSNFGTSVVVSTVGGDPEAEGLWGSLLGDGGLLTVDNRGITSPEGATYGPVAGTSVASPLAAGVVSLMLGVNPALTVAQLINGVRLTARPHVVSTQMGDCSAANPGRCACTRATCGAGILDAAQALLYARDPAAYVATAQTAAAIDSPEIASAMALGADQPPNTNPPEADGGGGGALAPGWLLLLGLAVAALARRGGPHAHRA